MCRESIKQRIADLRDRAAKTRHTANREPRYQDCFQGRINAIRLDAEADKLKRECKSIEG